MKNATLKLSGQTLLTSDHQVGTQKGTDGNDVFIGTNFADRFDGGLGDDALYGGNGRDILEGGAGNDTLAGGNGNDILRGGAGADVFLFASVKDSVLGTLGDQITDFTTGVDKIDLRFMGGATFNATGLVAGQGPQVTYVRSQALLFGDVNGDGVADFSIYVNGAPVVTGTDFLF